MGSKVNGLPLDVRIQTQRYAVFRLLRADAPHERLREEWSKLETLLDTPSTNGTEGAGKAPIGEDTPYWRTLRAALVLPVEEQFAIAKDLAANCGYELTGDAYSAPPQPAPDAMREALDARQRVVIEWGERCFGANHMRDKIVRAARFFEEAAELVQSIGLSRDHAMRAFDHVYSRPAGNPAQEAGGVANTLMALCGALDLSFDECQRAEIDRCLAKDPEHFAKRNEAKLREVDALAASVPSPDGAGETRGHCWCGLHVTLRDQCDRCMKRGAFSPSGAGVAEPVAWRWKHRRDNAPWHIVTYPIGNSDRVMAEPLYAAPPVRGDREIIRAFEALEVWRKAEQARHDASAAYNTRLKLVREERERGNWSMHLQLEATAIANADKIEVVKRRELFSALSNHKETDSAFAQGEC